MNNIIYGSLNDKILENLLYPDNVKTNMSKKTKKIKNVQWVKDEFSVVETAEKTFRYPTDYECIWGISPFVNLTEKANIPVSNVIKICSDLINNEGFVLYYQGGLNTWMDNKLINHDKRIFIHFENKTLTVQFYPLLDNKRFIESIINKFLSKSIIEKNNNFVMIAQGPEGLYNEDASYQAKPLKDDRFDLYYGSRFPHDTFLRFMDDETENLLMLHGDPGSGKSNYIKHLISTTEKTVIYIPPSMLGVISQPSFVSYMLANRNAVLLIEDAEEILSIDRNSATNNLLGLTDGFLRDSLNLKIIVTFNCDIGKIDPALLRKGRLYFEYKFDKLTKDESQKLMDHCEINGTADGPMTLAEIFNMDHETTQQDSFENRFIGFQMN